MRRSLVTSLARGGCLAVVAGALVACGGNTGAEPSGTSSERPTELRLAIGGEPDDGFDPTLGWGRYGSPLFQSTLLKRGADFQIENDLATDYSVSEDGLTWTVEIRTDATFTNGEPVTADDVAFTFNRAAEQGGLTDVSALDEAVALDANTVTFTLEEPRSTFVNRLIALGIVPQDGYGDGYATEPVGSGPFQMVSWQRGQQLVVERNDDYYGEMPEFDRIVFLFTDEDASLAAARVGEVQVAGVVSTLATQEIEGMSIDAVASLDNRALSFATVPDGGRTTEEGYPIGNDVTSDVAVRRAINLVVDRQALVDGVLEGFGSPASGPVDGTPWSNPDASVVGEDADPEAASALLEEAGWTDADGDGLREKDGAPARFTLLYPADDALRQGLAIAVADQVTAAGIEIETEGTSFEDIETRMHRDAVLFGWGSYDPTEMYNLYASSEAGIEYNNPGFYSNPTVDAYFEEALRATDPEVANEAWRNAQLDDAGNGFSASTDAAWAWLVNLEHTYYVDDCLDLGEPLVEPHGHGYPITAGITGWTWTC